MANGWTPQRKLKQAAMIRTWKPWTRSTGAKTIAGKQASSQNAVVHGAYAGWVKSLNELLNEFATKFVFDK